MTITQEMMNTYLEACSQPQSSYALQHLVDGGQLTPHRRFRQAVIELSVSQQSLRDAEYKLEELKIDLMEASDTSPSNPYDARRKEIKLAKLRSDIEQLERGLRGLRREMNVHLNMLAKYKEELGISEDASVEDVYQLLESHERDHYVVKLSADIAAQYVQANGGPSVGVTLALQQLPPEDIERVAPLVQTFAEKFHKLSYTKGLHAPEGVAQLEADGKKLLQKMEEATKTASSYA
jgi:hypothetical protein